MDDGAIDTYLETAYKNFEIQPTFPPGALVEVESAQPSSRT